VKNCSNSIAKTVIIHDNVIIEDGVIIHDYVVLYPGTILKKGVEVFDHCVIGKMPVASGNLARSLKSSYGQTTVGENSILCPGVILYAGIEIGDHVLLGDHCSIREECKIGSNCIIGRSTNINYATTIGNDTKIMDSCIITGNMTIGNHVFMGANVITTNDNSMGRNGYDEGGIRGPVIHDGARIGAAANILPSIVVGENAVVGAGSVVTKHVAAGALVMGVPAKEVSKSN
jgi:acetyltransferase-like isoleucine patch superfamily enzyme